MDKHSLVISSSPMDVGGHCAVSTVKEGHEGPCSVHDTNDKLIAALPNYAEAEKVARYAITPDGGYGSAYISESKASEPITHNTFDEWAFGTL